MSRISSGSRIRDPEDVVAIFHCSFHPTLGNVIDWSMKASEDLNLDGIEFSTLPSGLHLVDEDVVHITQEVHHGISVFRRIPTTEPGMRGYRLESLGILVARSPRPRPWRHLQSLKELSRKLADHWTSAESSYGTQEDQHWSLLKDWYSRRVFRRVGEEGRWVDWVEELSTEGADHPVLHLPHLLRILGPSSLTLYKHVLARRRVLIYTQPVVEPACILARVASDICGEDRPNVLGMVGINDVEKLNTESWRGNGWIACTTDAIFLEKPSLYDLIIDLTASRSPRPAFFVSRAAPSSPRGPRHKLYPVRFTFSDVRLWSELERALRADGDEVGYQDNNNKTRWSDGWRIYEEACVICAGLWMGSWRSPGFSIPNSSASTKGAIRLDGEDEGIRTLGRGIEGRPAMGASSPPEGSPRVALSRQAQTTLTLLNIFRAHTEFLSERLSELLDDASPGSETQAGTLVLSPRDVMSLELGVLSELDAKFLEWLAERNEKSGGRKVVVRRGWKDLLSFLLGFG